MRSVRVTFGHGNHEWGCRLSGQCHRRLAGSTEELAGSQELSGSTGLH